MISKELLKEIRNSPELSEVEIISSETDRLELVFKPETPRTGKELLTVQKILFNYKLFNFIKSEKVDFWTECIKTISISFY